MIVEFNKEPKLLKKVQAEIKLQTKIMVSNKNLRGNTYQQITRNGSENLR